MEFVTESPEHHFLTTLEKLRQDAAGWAGMHFSLSTQLDYNDVISEPGYIKGKLFEVKKSAESLARKIQEKGISSPEAILYQFSDCDIILLIRPESETARQTLQTLYKEISAQAGEKISTYSNLVKGIYDYQKIADQRLLGAKRIEAYEDMADANRVASIPLRRQRRDDALVMVVEDDRFTASYASNILNKQYEMVLARSGEEAISCYIEHAPDIVFLDIHLPGLSGNDTLLGIRAIDPDAFIVMLSVDTSKTNIVTASKGGAAGFLKKPFSKERMLHIVQSSSFVKNREQNRR